MPSFQKSLIVEQFQGNYLNSSRAGFHLAFAGGADKIGFHVTSSTPYWWTKTKDLSLASFVRPPAIVHFSIIIGVSRGWLKTSFPR